MDGLFHLRPMERLDIDPNFCVEQAVEEQLKSDEILAAEILAAKIEKEELSNEMNKLLDELLCRKN